MKRANGQGTRPYKVGPNKWRAEVTLGWDEQGRRRRKVVTRSTQAACEDAYRALLNERDSGVLNTSAAPTLSAWLEHWLEVIAAPTLRRRTVEGYRSKINTWITGTALAKTRIDKITPEHLDALYARMRAAGREGSTVQMHRILARSFKIAVRRGRLKANPCDRMDSPQPKPFEGKALTVSEARKLISRAEQDPNGLRWMMALALGLRQGERLGLAWDCVNLDSGTVEIRRTLERVGWRHGCTTPACGHRRAADCPKRFGGGLYLGEPKSRAGRRVLALPTPLHDALIAHRNTQVADKAAVWSPFCDPDGTTADLVFAQTDGKPIDPSADRKAWVVFLAEAGVDSVRLHDARHTAATMLLVLGQDPRVVMELMGWSQVSMLARYQHVMDELRRGAASAVGNALWGALPEPDRPDPVVVSLDERRRRKHGSA